MTKKDLVLLFSRAFALFLTTWALVEISYLPERLFALSHHIDARSILASHDYWSTYYSLVTAFLAVRIVALLVGAVLFWKSGPRVQGLFSPQEMDLHTRG